MTGVRGLEAACEIVSEDGKLRVYHRNYMRDLMPDELPRTRVLMVDPKRRVAELRLLAQEAHPDAYRLYPLKGYAGPPPSSQAFTREQLALAESDIYFDRPFSHQKHER